MEQSGSLPHSQNAATYRYLEPDRSSPCLPSHFPKTNFNVILPSTPGSFKWSSYFRLSHQNPVCTSRLPLHARCPAHVSPRFRKHFVTWSTFYSEEFLAPCLTPKLEDHPLSAVCVFLFSIFTATLHNWRPFLHPQPDDALCRGDRDPLTTTDV